MDPMVWPTYTGFSPLRHAISDPPPPLADRQNRINWMDRDRADRDGGCWGSGNILFSGLAVVVVTNHEESAMSVKSC